MQKEHKCDPATPIRLNEYVWKVKSYKIIFLVGFTTRFISNEIIGDKSNKKIIDYRDNFGPIK